MFSTILLNQFYIYFILILIGFIASKFDILDSNKSSLLSDFILHITFPLLIFTTVTHLSFNINILKNLIFVFLFTYISLLLLYITSYGTSILSGLNGNSRKVHILHSMFGNIVFIGFPFINALFPDGQGIFYAATYQIAADSVLWTFGIIYIRNNKQKDRTDSFRHLLNINTIAFFVALSCLFFGLHLPSKIEKPFSLLGQTTLVLSLVFVGHILSTINIQHMVKKTSLYLLSINKLIFVPVFLIFIIFYIKMYFPFLEKAAISAIILQCGMPAMATIAILAKKYDSDYLLASENIFISTVLSTLTLPLLWYLINLFF
jgi:malate permease and related proteins